MDIIYKLTLEQIKKMNNVTPVKPSFGIDVVVLTVCCFPFKEKEMISNGQELVQSQPNTQPSKPK